MKNAAAVDRHDLIRQGQRLEYFTIAYNSLEGLISIVAGIVAGSVFPIGFGLDSVIEVRIRGGVAPAAPPIPTHPGVR